jgi:hypothetical protein
MAGSLCSISAVPAVPAVSFVRRIPSTGERLLQPAAGIRPPTNGSCNLRRASVRRRMAPATCSRHPSADERFLQPAAGIRPPTNGSCNLQRVFVRRRTCKKNLRGKRCDSSRRFRIFSENSGSGCPLRETGCRLFRGRCVFPAEMRINY